MNVKCQINPAARLAQRFGVDFPFLVGPMVGISHAAMRDVVRHYTPESLAPLLFTEMLSTLRLPSERLDRADELQISDADRGHFIPQILGNDEWYISRSLKRLEPLEPWGIDINMGCPVKRTLRHNWGVRLMGDPIYAGQVVSMTKKHTNHPVSVKMRCGTQSADFDSILRFTDQLEKSGVDWITIHARTQSQKHSGPADWGLVGRLCRQRNVPVVVNGDVQTAADATAAYRDFGVDGVMIGRAITARPWLLWQIAEDLGYQERPHAFPDGKAPRTPDEEGDFYLQSLLLLISRLQHHFSNPTKQLKKLRFYVITSQKWLFFGHSFYGRLMKCKTLEEAAEFVSAYRSQVSSFPMTPRITLH